MAKIDQTRLGNARNMRDNIEEIRANYPLSAMVDRYTPVRRNAQGGVACCLFHDDRDPSLSIYANDTRFQCHGCGASGDVIDFVQRMHGVSFSEALAMLTDGTIPAPEPIERDHPDNIDRIHEARALFAQAAPAEGTLTETYAIATARADRDAAADLRGALITPKVQHFAAITTPKEAGRLMRAINAYTGHYITAFALRITPHLFVRPGELRTAEWTEFDLDDAIWSIPAAKTKMRRHHRVPLSTQVIDLITMLHPLTGHSKYLFPSVRTPRECMSENTVNVALRRMGFGKDEMTAHGFRAMAATLLNEMGIWNPDAIEKQLAHLDTSMVRRAYTRGAYWDERVRMMQHWSDYLDKLRDGGTVLRPKFGSGAA